MWFTVFAIMCKDLLDKEPISVNGNAKIFLPFRRNILIQVIQVISKKKKMYRLKPP